MPCWPSGTAEKKVSSTRWKRWRHEAVIVVLALAPRLDQPGDSQQRQVMADCRLALAEHVAQCPDVQFLVLGKEEQDPQAGFIGEQFEDLHEIFDGRIGNVRHGSIPRADGLFGNLADHAFAIQVFGQRVVTAVARRGPSFGRGVRPPVGGEPGPTSCRCAGHRVFVVYRCLKTRASVRIRRPASLRSLRPAALLRRERITRRAAGGSPVGRPRTGLLVRRGVPP